MRIQFKPPASIFYSGQNPVLLLEELRALGPCSVVVRTEAIPCLEDYQAESCYVAWDIVLQTREDPNAIRDVFIFVEDEAEIVITEEPASPELAAAPAGSPAPAHGEPGSAPGEPGSDPGPAAAAEAAAEPLRIGEILVARGDLAAEDLQQVLARRKKLGKTLLDHGLVNEAQVQAALAQQEQARTRAQAQAQAAAGASIRVPAQRLDTLVDLVGELVTVQAHLTQIALSRKESELLLIAEEVDRLTAALRDNALGLRMVPIGSTFGGYRRLVRDLAAELGKEVRLVTEGAETELDKTVIERIHDPIVHLLRNSVDHGIEAPAERAARGKPPCGTVHLAARHSGAHVLIEIRDDGGGLAPAAIRAKAVARGMLAADAPCSDQDLFALILTPGFSTAAAVTHISGRGVGMDVVKKSIEALRGTIEIASEPGAGTQIRLLLPLTLAIIDGLLVCVADRSFVLPLATVEECVELTRESVAQANGRPLIRVRGDVVAYVRLRELFGIPGEAPAVEQIVIATVAGTRVGFVVDRVIGGHQTVIKSLGRLYRDVVGVSGATILGDGAVALILDLPKLVESADRAADEVAIPSRGNGADAVAHR